MAKEKVKLDITEEDINIYIDTYFLNTENKKIRSISSDLLLEKAPKIIEENKKKLEEYKRMKEKDEVLKTLKEIAILDSILEFSLETLQKVIKRYKNSSKKEAYSFYIGAKNLEYEPTEEELNVFIKEVYEKNMRIGKIQEMLRDTFFGNDDECGLDVSETEFFEKITGIISKMMELDDKFEEEGLSEEVSDGFNSLIDELTPLKAQAKAKCDEYNFKYMKEDREFKDKNGFFNALYMLYVAEDANNMAFNLFNKMLPKDSED